MYEKEAILKVIFTFCHVEWSETSRVFRVEILHYIQNDKEDNTSVIQIISRHSLFFPLFKNKRKNI